MSVQIPTCTLCCITPLKSFVYDTRFWLVFQRFRLDLVPLLIQCGGDRNQRYHGSTLLTHALMSGAPEDGVAQLITPENINDGRDPALLC